MLLVLPEELSVLRDMQPLDRDVFNYLAERVDYETGLIGKSRRVSHGGIALDLSERDVPRRTKDSLRKVTSAQVENSIKRLVAAGLLFRCSRSTWGSDLVLSRVIWACYVSTDSSVKNPDATTVAVQLLLIRNLFNINNNELEKKNDFSYGSVATSVATTSLHQHQIGGADKFLMSLDWKPTTNELEMILHRAGGFKINKIDPAWDVEFVSYWFGEGKRMHTQAEWTSKYGRRMVDIFRNPQLYNSQRGIVQATQAAEAVNREHLPDWAKIPRQDELLVQFMRKFGYGDPPAGMDYRQARAWLERQVELKKIEWRKGLS